jgi:hypothetical protein
MKQISTLFLFLLFGVQVFAQTTHTVNLPSSGTNTVNVTCAVGDVLLFKSTATPLAIKIFKSNGTSYSVTPSSNTTSYTVTAIDTSYSSILSLAPVSTCVGKINLSVNTSIDDAKIISSIISTYPNPVKERLYIKGNFTEQVVKVYNISGSLVSEQKINNYINSIDVDFLPPSVYILEINNRAYRFVKVQ